MSLTAYLLTVFVIGPAIVVVPMLGMMVRDYVAQARRDAREVARLRVAVRDMGRPDLMHGVQA